MVKETGSEIDNGLSEIHCVGCGRFLGNAAIVIGVIQIKCPKCKKWTTISNWPEGLDNGLKIQYSNTNEAE